MTCLHFPTKGDVSGSVAFPHFLWLLFPLHSLCFFLVPSHIVIYIVLPLLLQSEEKFFKPLITVPLKGKTIKELKSSKYFNLFSVQIKPQGVYH